MSNENIISQRLKKRVEKQVDYKISKMSASLAASCCDLHKENPQRTLEMFVKLGEYIKEKYPNGVDMVYGDCPVVIRDFLMENYAEEYNEVLVKYAIDNIFDAINWNDIHL